MLKRIHIKGYKSLSDVAVELEPLTVLFGPNAAGKSWPGAIVKAIPEPHIERWLLLDGAASRAAVGKGCQAPDLKCRP